MYGVTYGDVARSFIQESFDYFLPASWMRVPLLGSRGPGLALPFWLYLGSISDAPGTEIRYCGSSWTLASDTETPYYRYYWRRFTTTIAYYYCRLRRVPPGPMAVTNIPGIDSPTFRIRIPLHIQIRSASAQSCQREPGTAGSREDEPGTGRLAATVMWWKQKSLLISIWK